MNPLRTYLIVGANSPLSQRIAEKLPPEKTFVLFHSEPLNKIPKVTYIALSDLGKLPHIHVVFIISAFVPDPVNSNMHDHDLYNVNVAFIRTITDHFKSSKIVFASSVSIYKNSAEMISENSEIAPSNSYSISKLWGETIIKRSASYSIIRISSLIGEGVRGNTFIPMITEQAMNNNSIVLFGKGNRKQNYINCKDAAALFIKASETTKNETYLAVSPNSYSNSEVAQTLVDLMQGTNLKYQGEDDSPSFYYDARRTYKELDFVPEITIKASLEEIIKWKQKLS